MKKEVQELFPYAIKAVKKCLTNGKGDIVLKEYDGYAASLGAALRTSGLIPTLAFYTDISKGDGSKGEARRYKLLQAVAYCIMKRKVDESKTALLERVVEEIYESHEKKIKEEKEREWIRKITHASIALKLAMRNFKHSDDKEIKKSEEQSNGI